MHFRRIPRGFVVAWWEAENVEDEDEARMRMVLRMKLCPHDDGDAISKVMKTTRILAFVLKMNEPQSYPRDIVKILNVLRGKTTMEGGIILASILS